MTDPRPVHLTTAYAAPARLPPAEQLARLWEQGAKVELDQFLNDTGPLSPAGLTDVLHVDQHHRWQSGERPTVESYLQRFPALIGDPDAVVDVIFHEFLIRERLKERPEPKEYLDRFHQYAAALQSQLEFHRLLNQSDSALANSQLTDSTAVDSPEGAPLRFPARSQIELLARGGLSTNRDIQTLLKRRLRLLALISCVGFLFYIPVLWTLFSATWGTALYAAVLVETAVIAVVLSGRRSYAIGTLRRIEACLYFGLTSFFSYQQVQFFQAGFFSALTLDTWTGPVVAARSMSWPWAVMIISYGIMIPNTARRCLMAVGLMAAFFLAITLGLALTTSAAPATALAGYVLCSLTDMAFAGALAIFGAYRIQTLQRVASEARRLGPYRLIRHLGSGGMGEVYLAEHALLRRPCALKLIRAELVGDAHSLSRFEREVQSMATLTHPNTVRVYDYGLATDGTFYYAMEFLPGLSLQELVTRYGPLPGARAVYLLRQVCEALREAHAIRLVHRDIKPDNVLACQAGGMHDVAKLLDFGLVRVHGLNQDSSNLTGVGTLAGTPAFMSPEQAAGAADIDARSDIYSLGAVAYFLLTGRPPFIEPTSVQTMAAHLTADVVPPRERQPLVPADLESVVLRCLQKDRAHRFQDVDSLLAALNSTQCATGWTSPAAADWWRETDRAL